MDPYPDTKRVVTDVPVTLGEWETMIDFFTEDGVPVDVLLGIPEMERWGFQIDLAGQFVDFTVGRRSVRAGFEPDRTIKKIAGDK